LFKYESPVGPMIIGYDKNAKMYALIINQELVGHYYSNVAAADDVYMHVTGHDEWDNLDGEIDSVPTDINEWTIIRKTE